MKIDVTYEKADIIRLVKEDLERRQIRLKVGTAPDYKGALQVRLSIEAEDEDEAPTRAQAAPAPPSGASQGKGGSTPAPDEAADMGAILNQSRHVAATTKPTFKSGGEEGDLQRTLGRDESLEFPR